MANTNFDHNNYEYFYFETRMKRGSHKLVATFQARWMAEEFAEKYDLDMIEVKQAFNTKENNEHYKGKIWVTKGYQTRKGCNICADVGKEELMVIAFVPEITEQVVESQIRSFGWRPEQWLAEEA